MQEFLLKISKWHNQSFCRTLLSSIFMDQTLDNPQNISFILLPKIWRTILYPQNRDFFFFTYFWDTIYSTFVEKIKRIQIHV